MSAPTKMIKSFALLGQWEAEEDDEAVLGSKAYKITSCKSLNNTLILLSTHYEPETMLSVFF